MQNNKKKKAMKNITINIPKCYDENIQKLIGMGMVGSRSEAIRLAIKEYLQKEYNENLQLLEFFELEDSSDRYPELDSNQSNLEELDIIMKTTKEE